MLVSGRVTSKWNGYIHSICILQLNFAMTYFHWHASLWWHCVWAFEPTFGDDPSQNARPVQNTSRYKVRLLPPKLICPLKNSGWKTILSFWNGPFLGDTLVFGGVSPTTWLRQNIRVVKWYPTSTDEVGLAETCTVQNDMSPWKYGSLPKCHKPF